MLFQIVERQERLQQAYAARTKAVTKDKKSNVKLVSLAPEAVRIPTPLPAIPPPPMPEVEYPAKEKTIAIGVPVSLHLRIESAMGRMGVKASKREFVYNVLNAALDVLGPKH